MVVQTGEHRYCSLDIVDGSLWVLGEPKIISKPGDSVQDHNLTDSSQHHRQVFPHQSMPHTLHLISRHSVEWR